MTDMKNIRKAYFVIIIAALSDTGKVCQLLLIVLFYDFEFAFLFILHFLVIPIYQHKINISHPC